MRRALAVVPLLIVVVALAVVLTRDGSADRDPDVARGLTASDLPFPRAATPLPVPEVRIPSGPWRDELEAPDDPVVPPRIVEPRGASCPEGTTPFERRGTGIGAQRLCMAD
jgi:hypothetical protein